MSQHVLTIKEDINSICIFDNMSTLSENNIYSQTFPIGDHIIIPSTDIGYKRDADILWDISLISCSIIKSLPTTKILPFSIKEHK